MSPFLSDKLKPYTIGVTKTKTALTPTPTSGKSDSATGSQTMQMPLSTDNNSQPIKAAIVGLGIAGAGFHVPLILSLPELFTLVYVVDSSPPSGVITTPNRPINGEQTDTDNNDDDDGHEFSYTQEFHERFGDTTRYLKEYEQVLQDEQIELFTVILHYSRTPSNPFILTATLRGHLLSAREPQERFVVRGSKGTFSKFGFDVQERQMQVDGRNAVQKENFGVEPENLWGSLEIVGEDGKEMSSRRVESLKGDYQALYRNLSGVIRNEEEPEVKWNDVELTMLITELALRSSKEGRTIEIPSVEEISKARDEEGGLDARFCSLLGSSTAADSSPPDSGSASPRRSPRRSISAPSSHSSASMPSQSTASTPPSSDGAPSSASSTFECPSTATENTCRVPAAAAVIVSVSSPPRVSLFRRPSSGHWFGGLFTRW
ncbi:hypothetical protein FRC17_000359 [Serendipita sp. 399]|nr:hypothetical protein FRC17_000359 [Serendipita sp. 399]